MSDIWSLKGKRVTQEVADDGDGYIDVWDEYSVEGKYYSIEDINILREKLIEDIRKLRQWDDDSAFIELPCEDVIEIINKRFGVDE